MRSSPARILEELYKILRQGRSQKTFEMLHDYGLLAYLLPEADRAIAEGGQALTGSLARLDAHRQAGLATPDQLSNALLMGSLLVPLGVPLRRVAVAPQPRRESAARRASPSPSRSPPWITTPRPRTSPPRSRSSAPRRSPRLRADRTRCPCRCCCRSPGATSSGCGSCCWRSGGCARPTAPAAARRMIAAKSYFDDAVRWLEIHGGPDGRELGAEWRALAASPPDPSEVAEAAEPGAAAPDAPSEGDGKAPPPPAAPAPAAQRARAAGLKPATPRDGRTRWPL